MKRVEEAVSHLKKVRVRKMHLDYIAGLLSLPVLATAIILNFANLSKKENSQQAKPAPTSQVIVVPQTQAPVQTCKKTIGPVIISSPQENQTVSDNPVCIAINYSDLSYCSVVWSYRINGGSWSDYTSNSPCLYNVPGGNVQFQLKINSTVTSETRTLTRNFIYSGPTPFNTPAPTSIPTNTPVPTSTPLPVASTSAH